MPRTPPGWALSPPLGSPVWLQETGVRLELGVAVAASSAWPAGFTCDLGEIAGSLAAASW